MADQGLYDINLFGGRQSASPEGKELERLVDQKAYWQCLRRRFLGEGRSAGGEVGALCGDRAWKTEREGIGALRGR